MALDPKVLRVWNHILDYVRFHEPHYVEILDHCLPVEVREEDHTVLIRCTHQPTLDFLEGDVAKKDIPVMFLRATNAQDFTISSMEVVNVVEGMGNNRQYMAQTRMAPVESSVLTLKAMRGKLGITQQKIAALLGVNMQTYGKWEKGVNRPKWDNIERLAKVFQTNPGMIQEVLGIRDITVPNAEDEESSELGEKGEPVRYVVNFKSPENDPEWKLDPWWFRKEKRVDVEGNQTVEPANASADG